MKNDLFDFRVEEYIPTDLTDDNLTTCKKYAKENDLRIVVPTARELFIDIDSEEDYKIFSKQFYLLTQFGLVYKDYRLTTSKSGNKHVVVTLLNPITPTERILLQAVLGSDRTRELLSYIRIRKGDPTPTIFFEKK